MLFTCACEPKRCKVWCQKAGVAESAILLGGLVLQVICIERCSTGVKKEGTTHALNEGLWYRF